MDNTTVIRIIAGLAFLCILGLGIGLNIFYILTLQRALNKCSPLSRTFQPGTMWLLLIPFFNLIWNFIVVLGVSASLGNEFRARNASYVDAEPGKSIGIAMSVCGACSIVPILGILAGLPYLILWIVYWVKIKDFSELLDQIPAASGQPPIHAL